MPCTLEPWEIEFEEKKANLETFGRELTDQALLEEVACQAMRCIQREGVLMKAPPLIRKWWRLHKRSDQERKRERKRKTKA